MIFSESLKKNRDFQTVYKYGKSAANKKLPVSPVLKEIGLKKDLLDSTVRFSFCENTTKEELEYCLQQLKELLMVLRRYSRH